MNMHIDLFGYVRRELAAMPRIEQQLIAQASGVADSTIQKIVYGYKQDAYCSTVQALANALLNRHPVPPPPHTRAAAPHVDQPSAS